MNLLSFIFFLPVIIVNFYIPGLVLVSFAGKKFTKQEIFFLSWPIGIAAFIFASYVFGWMQFPFGTLLLVAGACGYWFYKRKKIPLVFPQLDTWSVVIICLGAISFV